MKNLILTILLVLGTNLIKSQIYTLNIDTFLYYNYDAKFKTYGEALDSNNLEIKGIVVFSKKYVRTIIVNLNNKTVRFLFTEYKKVIQDEIAPILQINSPQTFGLVDIIYEDRDTIGNIRKMLLTINQDKTKTQINLLYGVTDDMKYIGNLTKFYGKFDNNVKYTVDKTKKHNFPLNTPLPPSKRIIAVNYYKH
jgi:hypothetical protein